MILARVWIGILSILMGLFAVLQLNDPDAFIWILVYSFPALFAAICSLKPENFLTWYGPKLLFLNLLILSFASIIYLPFPKNWWQFYIWWNSETVREGIGLMVATFVVVNTSFVVNLWKKKFYSNKN